MQIQEQFEDRGHGLIVHAPAKVNLSLLVGGRRVDGYHQVQTIMAKVSLYDRLYLEPVPGGGDVELTCGGPYWAPEGEQNLAYRAARLLLQQCGLGCGVRITLDKQVPAGSGLGSASSDAAAVILGLDRLLGLGRPADLMQLAAGLGSDVAFFLGGPVAMCEGRGELVRPIEGPLRCLVLLVLPSIHVSTAEVYGHYRHDGTLYRRLQRQVTQRLETGGPWAVWQLRANMLAAACYGLYPQLKVLRDRIADLIGPVNLSGSGSAMYRLYRPDCLVQAQDDCSVVVEQLGCTALVAAVNPW